MTIELSKLSDLQLLSLISEATAELSARAAKPLEQRIADPTRPTVTIREPDAEQKEFVMMIKGKMQRGDYIRASERHDVAAITSIYPEWSRKQRMPTSPGASAWRSAAEHMTAPRAKER